MSQIEIVQKKFRSWSHSLRTQLLYQNTKVELTFTWPLKPMWWWLSIAKHLSSFPGLIISSKFRYASFINVYTLQNWLESLKYEEARISAFKAAVFIFQSWQLALVTGATPAKYTWRAEVQEHKLFQGMHMGLQTGIMKWGGLYNHSVPACIFFSNAFPTTTLEDTIQFQKNLWEQLNSQYSEWERASETRQLSE